MEHLDRGLEHLDEFEQALVGEAQPARIAVGVRVVLRKRFELADVDLAYERGDILVVFIARLGLGDGHLPQDRRLHANDAELVDVAVELLDPLHGPGAHDPVEVARWDAVFLLERRAVALGVEKAERRFVHRRALERVDRVGFHERLEALGDGGLAAAHRTEQVKDLLSLLKPLRGVLEIGDDLRNRLVHAVELAERRVPLDHAVGKEPRKAGVVAGVDDLRLADGREHALCGGCVSKGVFLAELEILRKRHFLVAGLGVLLAIEIKQGHGGPPSLR